MRVRKRAGRKVEVAAGPRTRAGEKLERPVKRALQGAGADRGAGRGSRANPGSLAAGEAFAAERKG